MYLVKAKMDGGYVPPALACKCPVCHHDHKVDADASMYVCRCGAQIQVEHESPEPVIEVVEMAAE